MRWGGRNLGAKYFGFFRLNQLHFSHLNDKPECKMENLDSSSLLMLEEEVKWSYILLQQILKDMKDVDFGLTGGAFHSALTLKLSVNPSS